MKLKIDDNLKSLMNLREKWKLDAQVLIAYHWRRYVIIKKKKAEAERKRIAKEKRLAKKKAEEERMTP